MPALFLKDVLTCFEVVVGLNLFYTMGGLNASTCRHVPDSTSSFL
ncbi:hypothetical protein SLEP1_g26519 [Rubroshorea leprosula]|uniref:Uncharacterized protein n=1 Tax=Rubroshorea leprosula TaxID=152421 RepID=A0AAV5JVY1_9ROSI|nr:hypothetical protein SLEP1_g26519 [Rubroshorea leprosula]